MIDLIKHRRQFLICSRNTPQPNAEWVSITLTDSTVLYHSPELSVACSLNALGQKVVLLGTAIECAGCGLPQSRLNEITHESFREVTDTWGNRWSLLINTSITCDASGMLGVYFPDLNHRMNQFAVSSSPRLLGDLFPGCDDQVRGTSYSPSTPLAGILSLLPGQWLNVETGEIEQPKQPIFDQIDNSDSEIREECCAILKEFMRQAYDIELKELWISLSGGADSRRNLAAAIAAKIPCRPFSFLKKYWQASDADRKIPRSLGKIVGVETLLIDAGTYQVQGDLAKAYREHTTFRDTVDPGELFYYFSGGSWDELPRKAAVVDGQNYELVANYYYREVEAFKSPQEMLNWRFECPDETRPLSLDFLVSATGGSMNDMRDFAFLLANSSVYGQMYQAMDLWCNVYVPANCRRLYSLAQSIDESQRQDKKFWISVTDALEPHFTGIPTNPRDGLFKFLVNLVRQRGFASTVKLISTKTVSRVRTSMSIR